MGGVGFFWCCDGGVEGFGGMFIISFRMGWDDGVISVQVDQIVKGY